MRGARAFLETLQALAILSLFGFVGFVLVHRSVGCAANATPARRTFTIISDFTNGVQSSMRVYREQECGLQRGDPGPGTCDPRSYARVVAAYDVYTAAATAALKESERTGAETSSTVRAALYAFLDRLAQERGIDRPPATRTPTPPRTSARIPHGYVFGRVSA